MLNQIQGRLNRRYIALIALVLLAFITWRTFDYTGYEAHELPTSSSPGQKTVDSFKYIPSTYDWGKSQIFFPQDVVHSPPKGQPKQFPKIQAEPPSTPPKNAARPLARRELIKAKFVKSWEAYKTHAWTTDELMPLSSKGKQTLCGWSAQLVDALDTLWIMGLKDDFRRAVKEVAVIDWAKTTDETVNLFEVTIRYLGGLLAAYELSGEIALLDKARELGDLLYMSFDTPNGLPNHYFDYEKAKQGKMLADKNMSGAAGGSLYMEFTRLSQLTGDPKYFDATERVKLFLHRVQNETAMPGLWPLALNWEQESLVQPQRFTLGAGADSMYEYLPKMHLLLGGLDPAYEEMTVLALDTAKEMLLFKPMTKEDANILMAGNALMKKDERILTAEMQHLTCFAGGMYALAGRLLTRDDYVDLGSRLTDGCVYAYDAFETNIMPEVSQLIACDSLDEPCAYNASLFSPHRRNPLPEGFLRVRDTRYLLRPEAIESVFYMWRITGDQVWRDAAWRMFEGIVKEAETETAFASVSDVRKHSSNKADSMETFWLGETLKYFYLIFEDPNVLSLDEWVFNTEAHPLKRPTA